MKIYPIFPTLSLAAAIAIQPAPVFANNFENRDVSIVAKGQAGAGLTAGTDITASSRNPAIVGTAESVESAIAGFYRFSDRKGTSSLGGPATDVEDGFFIGSGAIAAPISGSFGLGLAVYQPLRLRTDYPVTFPSAGDIIYDHLNSVTIQPNVAASLSDNLHVGLGVGFTRLKASLGQATLTGPGTITGTDWAFNWTVGAIYQFGDGGSIGASYRSKTDFDFDSTLSPGFTVPTPGGPVNIGGSASVSGDFPASFSVGAIIPAGSNLKLSVEVQWTDWSNFNIVTIRTAAGPVIPLVNTTKDSWMFSAGAEYSFENGAAIRAGVGYDKSPIRVPPGNVRFPYDDIFTLSIGGSLPLGDKVIFDAAFSHEFMGNETAQVVNGAPGSSVSFEGDRNIVSIGMRFKM